MRRRSILGSVVIAVVLAVGCTERPEPDPRAAASGAAPASASAKGTASTSPPSAHCTEETAALSAWLNDLAAEGVLLPAPSKDLTTVTVEDRATAIRPGPRVEITAKEISFDGQLAGKTAALAATGSSLAALAKKTKATLGEVAPGTALPAISIDVDRNATWSAIAEASRALAASGFERLTFLLAAKSAIASPPPSSIDAELGPSDTLRLDPRPPIGPGTDGKVFRGCISVRDFLAQVAGAGEAKPARVAKELAGAMQRCDCRFDMGAAKALVWTWYGRKAGAPRRGVEVTLAKPGEDATDVAAAAAAPWSETHAALVTAAAKGKPVRFVAR